MRSTSIKTLTDLADSGHDVVLLTGDLGFKVLDPFREKHPERFVNVGVAEANMASIAAGLALDGCRPVCYSMVPFLFMRAFEQVRVDIVGHQLPVVLLGVGGGLSYGSEGMTHHAIEDIAIARSLPGLRIMAPGDPFEADAALRFAIQNDGPTFIRLGKNGDPALHDGPLTDITKPLVVPAQHTASRQNPSQRAVMFATGHILAAAAEAQGLLIERGIELHLISVPLIKPLEAEAIRRIAAETDAIVTVEEHSIIGGLGTHIAEILFETGYKGRFKRIGLPDEYCTTHGTLGWLRKQYHIDPEGIANQITEFLNAS